VLRFGPGAVQPATLVAADELVRQAPGVRRNELIDPSGAAGG
jgi:hypothetical protein